MFPMRHGQTYRVELSFEIKYITMDNVQNCDRYINIPLSQTFR
jgi:hypothetical protein